MIRWDRIWKFDDSGASYSDQTNNQKSDSAITFLDDSADYFYFGLDRRPRGFYVDLSTNGSYGAFTYQYWNGAWTNLTITNNYTWSSSSYCLFLTPDDMERRRISSTDPHTATSPNTEIDLYWIRVSTASVTTAATISKIRAIPFCTYATPSDVSAFLQFERGFDESRKPTVHDVEEYLRRAEDRVDFETRKSWRFNLVEDEEQDYNQFGIRLKFFPIIKAYSAEIWNGAAYESLDEGRTQDWFTINDTGMMYFSRYFTLPARLAGSIHGWQWNYAEFKMPTRFTYAWGRDPEKDRQFYMAKKVTVMIAALDVLQNVDYTVFFVQGTDRQSYDSKIRNWREEINETLALMQSWVGY